MKISNYYDSLAANKYALQAKHDIFDNCMATLNDLYDKDDASMLNVLNEITGDVLAMHKTIDFIANVISHVAGCENVCITFELLKDHAEDVKAFILRCNENPESIGTTRIAINEILVETFIDFTIMSFLSIPVHEYYPNFTHQLAA